MTRARPAQYRIAHTHLTMQSSCSAAACSLQKALRLLSISVCCFCSSAQANPSETLSNDFSVLQPSTTRAFHYAATCCICQRLHVL